MLRFARSAVIPALLLNGFVALAQPVNDSLANATVLTTLVLVQDAVSFSGTITNATSEPGEDFLFPDALLDRGTIWWKWTCDAKSAVEFAVYSPTASLIGVAYSSLNSAPTFSQLAEVSPLLSDIFYHPDGIHEAAVAFFTAEAGRTYWFAVIPGPNLSEPLGAVAGKLTVTPLGPPPPATTNDFFATRTILSGTNLTVVSNNSSAGTEAGENIGGGAAMLLNTVWYSWTAPTNGVLRVTGSTPIPNFILSIGTYRGTAVNALTPAATTPDGGIAVQAGDMIELQIGTVYFTIWGGGGGSGPFTLHLNLELPLPTSPNDAFADRIDITTDRYHFEGSIYGATSEPGEPLPAPEANHTLWWKFDAPGDGLLNVLPSAGQFAAQLRVYQGTELNALTPLSPWSGTRYRVQGGLPYAIQVASGPLASGAFGLDVRFHSASNDFFAGSEHLEGTNIVYYGNFTLATVEPDEPPGGTNTVWLSWAAPFHGPVRYSLATSPMFQFVSVFTGPAVGHLQRVPVIGIPNRIYTFIARQGEVYHFQFGGDADEFQFSLQAEPFPPASNDHFAEAELVAGQYVYFTPRSVLGATLELGEPLHLGGTDQKSIWWKWQAPRDGFLNVSASSVHIPTIVLAVYQGPSVEALGEVAKGTNSVRFRAIAGQTYHLAAAVPADAAGYIQCGAQQFGMSDTSALLPGNILREPSWEGTGLGPQYWGVSGGLGGYVNERGGADGFTWPVLDTGTKIWQDFPTIPGHEYAVQFAYLIGHDLLSGCCGLGGVKLSWDDRELGITYVPEAETRFWHWNVYTARASNAVSRITFENIHRNLEMDAFSVVDLSAPPSIVTQPSSVSTVAGGVAAFIVVAAGTAPFSYQWYFDGEPMPGRNSAALVLEPAGITDAGSYTVKVSNSLGHITSAPASLLVDAPVNATILLQPTGGVVPAGSYFNLSVAAAGTPPLSYQWYLNGEALRGGTNRLLQFTNVQSGDAGTYSVRVANYGGSVYSLPASLFVTNAVGGGLIEFRNRSFAFDTTSTPAPVYDLDGLTRLNGPAFVAQLYAGPTVETMLPAASPTSFRSGFDAGFFISRIVSLANVAPGAPAVAQVRVWEISRGSSYEEARALGGKFGRSEVLPITAGGGERAPSRLTGLTSFSLRAGLPAFTVGVIELVERQPSRVLIWSLRGEPGFRYVIERYTSPHFAVWHPFQVVTNTTSTVVFSDSPAQGEGSVFYRARILD